MCGISGIIAYNTITPSDEASLIAMRNAIVHRGPDHQGIWKNHSVVFGHNRLSIIDLSDEANQPMVSVYKDVIISFNGEIYNHAEIKEKLVGSQKFRTDHSDTEVIINAYKEWGLEKALRKFKGMFAFALYDIKKQTTFLVRDRMGKKPLYFSRVNDKLYFSSEIKALLESDEIDRTINEEAIYHYLSFLTVNAPDTFYSNISKLEVGTYIKYSKKEFTKNTYWNISDAINTKCDDSYDTAVDTIKEKLMRSMKYRNVSDVPIAVALSGGVDSSLNLLYSSKDNPNINAINLKYETSHEFNESENARRFSKELGVDYTQLEINQEKFESELLTLCDVLQDMPFGDPNSVLLYYISKEAQGTKSKILLVGEGGDELGGYPVYISMLKEYQFIQKVPNFLRGLLKYIPLKKRFDFFYKGDVVSRRQVHGFTEFEKKKFWKGKPYNSYAVLHNLMQEVKGGDFLRKVLNVEYKLRLPELILARVDYPTMAASVEARSPYMDFELIQYCASLPFELKMKNGAKSMIKDVAREYLPDYITNGKKVGFGMLLHPFLTESLPKMFKKEVVDNNDAPVKKYIQESFLKKLGNKKPNPQLGYRLWIIYSLNRWLILNLQRSNKNLKG
ncbi:MULTISPECIES: asparagine synthase (glutamine-hydrolyzing) [Arenibacter]|uniref:asparagine synthase (glutamine-hydrolyzing) n=1 Tax=Arenibacter TaxID=178469 RepID=UPI000853D642|nr:MULTISPECIES: asparagine synthase (glutamine-hydrolyzing) [Arenibacter]GBF18513.1 asparagine synthetase [glutamine-hydrolyzing] 1 [Arenibacter sp. NBRC 103722]